MAQEIVIAGAGVAGLTAAISLHRAGRAVRVVDRGAASGAHRFPDWDAIENWTSAEDVPAFLARIGIDPDRFRHTGRSTFSVIDPYGRRHDVRTPRPFFYLIKRGAVAGGLEHGLQAQAEAAGIPIAYHSVCPPAQADIWAGGTFGQGSRFISAGFTFRTDHPDWICGLIDMTIAPRAYAYLAIVEGEGTLAVLLTEARHEANALLERAVAAFRRHTALDIRDRHRAGGSGGDLAAFWHGRRDFVIGEAGGYQDFLWGFGIRYALLSGYLAAQAVLTGRDWQALADAELRPLVRASLVNRWLYDRMPAAGFAALIRHFTRSPDLNALTGRWYHPRRFHHLLWPVAARHFTRQTATLAGHTRYVNRTRSGKS
ncbi:MAG TPA: FAD-binding protein [Chloroflexia bacterium]|nr:FAD-binding protein [Chloroflexia bacterium]